MLTRAAGLAADIPRTDEWVALNQRSLRRLLNEPLAAAIETRREKVLAGRRPFAWLGLTNPRARGAYCTAVLKRAY